MLNTLRNQFVSWSRDGRLYAVLAACGFSMKAIFVKLAYAAGPVDPAALLALRMGFALPLFLWLMRHSRGSEGAPRLNGTELAWDAVHVGHPDCHRIAYSAVFANGHVAPLFDDADVVAEMLDFSRDWYADRTRRRRPALRHIAKTALRRNPASATPRLWFPECPSIRF